MNWYARDGRAVFLLIAYFITFVVVLTFIKVFISPDKEVIRKGYHFFYSFSGIILMYYFASWLTAAITISVFFLTAAAYLFIEERFFPRKIFDLDREGTYNFREIIWQIMLVLTMQVLLIVIFRPILSQPFHAVMGMLIWGVGDAVAAVVGTKYGRINFPGIIMSQNKTLAGTLALIVSAGLTVILVVIFSDIVGITGASLFIYALVLAVTAGLAEGAAREGIDSLTMPLSTALVSYLFMLFFV